MSYRKLLPAVAAAAALATVIPVAQARQGADDPVGHDSGVAAQIERHGGDDPVNHDARDDRRVGERRHHHRHHHHRHHHERNDG